MSKHYFFALIAVLAVWMLWKDIQLYDLVLTTSARMLALTGEILHRDNYFLKVEPLEEIHRSKQGHMADCSSQ